MTTTKKTPAEQVSEAKQKAHAERDRLRAEYEAVDAEINGIEEEIADTLERITQFDGLDTLTAPDLLEVENLKRREQKLLRDVAAKNRVKEAARDALRAAVYDADRAVVEDLTRQKDEAAKELYAFVRDFEAEFNARLTVHGKLRSELMGLHHEGTGERESGGRYDTPFLDNSLVSLGNHHEGSLHDLGRVMAICKDRGYGK